MTAYFYFLEYLRVLCDDPLGHLQVLVVNSLCFLLASQKVETPFERLFPNHILNQLLLFLMASARISDLNRHVLYVSKRAHKWRIALCVSVGDTGTIPLNNVQLSMQIEVLLV